MKHLVITFLIFLWMSPAVAQDSHHGHGAHSTQTIKTDAGRELLAVNNKMMQTMDVALIGTPDADFIRTMIPHHQGATEMAQVVLKHGKDDRVKWLANNIIRSQGWEISWMKRWLGRVNQPLAVATGNGAMEKSANTPAKRELLHIHHNMHQAMDVKMSGNPDADFIRAMIPHHQGAIDMAYWVLTHGRNTEAIDLARDIIKAQTAEIAWMRHWLKNDGAGHR